MEESAREIVQKVLDESMEKVLDESMEKVVERSMEKVVERSIEKAFARQNYEEVSVSNLSDRKIKRVLSDEDLKLIMVSVYFLYFLSPHKNFS